MRRVRATIVAVEKQWVSHNLSVCLKPSLSSMQCACAILSAVAYLALQHILRYLKNCIIFEKRVIEHKMCVLRFSTTFIWNISHSKKKLAIYYVPGKMYTGIHVKCSLFLSDFNETELYQQILEKSSNIKFHENPSSRSRAAACGRTDMTKLIVAFRNFANAPKKTLLMSNFQFGTSRGQG
jgi:hypothetical protein